MPQLVYQIDTLGFAHFCPNDLLVHQLADLFFVDAVIHRLHGIAAGGLAQLGKETKVCLVPSDLRFRKALVLKKAA